MTSDTGQATQAAQMNNSLMRQYAAAGSPALSAGLNYAKQSLAAGQPGYVQSAYQDARTGALEASQQNTSASQAQLSRNLSKAGGGAFLAGIGRNQGAGSQALANETSHIATSQAIQGLTQRNQLLNVMQGGGASATNLSGGFGALTNQGLGMSAGANSPYGPIMGGLSALSGIYANSQTQGSSLAPTSWDTQHAASSQGNYAAGVTVGGAT